MQKDNTSGILQAFSKNLPIQVVLTPMRAIGAWASIRLVP
jgi:hypothetical protein